MVLVRVEVVKESGGPRVCSFLEPKLGDTVGTLIRQVAGPVAVLSTFVHGRDAEGRQEREVQPDFPAIHLGDLARVRATVAAPPRPRHTKGTAVAALVVFVVVFAAGMLRRAVTARQSDWVTPAPGPPLRSDGQQCSASPAVPGYYQCDGDFCDVGKAWVQTADTADARSCAQLCKGCTCFDFSTQVKGRDRCRISRARYELKKSFGGYSTYVPAG
eukprot:TRINITY_DN41386_c0_g1_i1.p1 TRINITY_DN41386_c0_g1~~TRINITY_DN41386_c0_g1_i1.p1  ORF type:complete len:234 (+),score=69.19 TRINITY_DN41386_c0_g1_i1:56-703(+)